jgi:hypothetical protein
MPRIPRADIDAALATIAAELGACRAAAVVEELADEVERLRAERDAWVAAVDRHVSESVAEAYTYAPAWVVRRDDSVAYYTRAEAEAAYRKAAGFPAAPEAPADGAAGE